MEISSLGLSSLPSINHHPKPTSKSNITLLLPNLLSHPFLSFKSPSQVFKTIHSINRNHFSPLKTASFAKTGNTHFPLSFENHKATTFFRITPTPSLNIQKDQFLIPKNTFFTLNILRLQVPVMLMAALYAPFPCFATETTSNKIDLESVLVSIDDFLNRNPFFVSGITFIWLVVIPLTEEYFKKFKFISALDAFLKLRNDPNSQLLDIRDKQSLLYLGSPNLKLLNKKTVQVQFFEGEEESFVNEVLQNFKDPGNTTICIVDNFDGNSMKVAEMLFKKGFKEAYAIRGGIRGKKGWQAIQETLLPPSVHVFPKNRDKSKQPEVKEGTELLTETNGQTPSVPTNRSAGVDNGHINTRRPSAQETLSSSGCLSPYPNYPDLKPPSSPTPSKPSD